MHKIIELLNLMIIHDTVLEEIKNYKINEINDILPITTIKSKNCINQNILYTRRFEHLY